MDGPRILVFSGSVRTGSLNGRLAAAAAQAFEARGAHVTRLSLADHPLPLYDPDSERASGPPEAAVALKRTIAGHDGVFIASPEYNAGYTPLLKNALDWASRARDEGEAPLAAFKKPVFGLGAATNGALGGVRGLIALRQMLELGLGALVLPEMVVTPAASEAFAEDGSLRAERPAQAMQALARRLVEMAQKKEKVGDGSA